MTVGFISIHLLFNYSKLCPALLDIIGIRVTHCEYQNFLCFYAGCSIKNCHCAACASDVKLFEEASTICTLKKKSQQISLQHARTHIEQTERQI